MPAVLMSAQNYMIRKAEEVELQAINAIKDYYNSSISITMSENLPKDAKSALAGYKFRFAPLNESASKKNWTGTWPESGTVKDTSTLIGFMTSGYPHTVEFFKPGDDPDSAKPEFVVPFKIAVPAITINVSAAPTFDELVGYYADGTVTITDVFVSDEFRAAMASTKGGGEDEIGCDLSEMIPAIEAQKGVPNASPFTIEKTGENSGTLRIEDDDEGAWFTLTYDPASGRAPAHYEGMEGIMFDGVFQAKYNADKTGVEISGDLETDLGMGAENMKLTLILKGSKALSE